MQNYLMDILACPECEKSSLELRPLEKNGDEIESGVLSCPDCHRWFPVRNGIPHLVRDGLRFPKADLEFLKKHCDALPPDIVEKAPPVNLSGDTIKRTPFDEDIIREGEYWSQYVRAHYEIGDTSFLDIRSKSTHPSFYPLGVLEPDERDVNRLYGMWPNHLGKRIYGFLESLEPGWSLDVGCGGGQFGLECSWLGWKSVGIDIAPGALEVARSYALEKNLNAQYIYADPSNPPFRKEVFDLLLIKDTLHHLHKVEESLIRIEKLLKEKGRLLIFDHVGYAPLFRWIMEKANRFLHPRITRRYSIHAVPKILKEESPSEDVGREDVVPLTKKFFLVDRIYREMMLYYHLELPVYYAFGRRRWVSDIVSFFTRWLVEKPMLLFQKGEYALIFGRKKKSTD